MKTKLLVLFFFGSLLVARADDTIAKAQQALKDQGFYYGQVSGTKDADTTASIRRYQIRNGLQVTGELDNETVRSLGASASGSVQQTARNSPPPRPIASEPADGSAREAQPDGDARLQPFARGPQNNGGVHEPAEALPNAPQDQRVYPSNPVTVTPPGGALFAGTPYAGAPPDVQREIVASAQRILERRDLYRGDIDGVYGPNMEFSLRAYQSRVGLPVTGRLDLSTLAGLNLLPGSHMPAFVPRRPILRPRFEAPVRGEWIRE